jgi:hypothetical protein
MLQSAIVRCPATLLETCCRKASRYLSISERLAKRLAVGLELNDGSLAEIKAMQLTFATP